MTSPGPFIAKDRILKQLGRTGAAKETWQQALRILASTGNPRAADVDELIAGNTG